MQLPLLIPRPPSRQNLPKRRARLSDRKGLTLVEAMVAMFLMAGFMLGFLDTFLQSRRATEETILHTAATSVVYGLIEQMKGLNYDFGLPITSTDPDQSDYDAFPDGAKSPPYIRVRLNQDQATWLRCVNNLNPANYTAPQTTPGSLAELDANMRNTIGPLSMSNVAGAKSHSLRLFVWVWVDSIADPNADVTDAKAVTLVYAYEFNSGIGVRTIIKRETFVTTRFGSMYRSS